MKANTRPPRLLADRDAVCLPRCAPEADTGLHDDAVLVVDAAGHEHRIAVRVVVDAGSDRGLVGWDVDDDGVCRQRESDDEDRRGHATGEPSRPHHDGPPFDRARCERMSRLGPPTTLGDPGQLPHVRGSHAEAGETPVGPPGAIASVPQVRELPRPSSPKLHLSPDVAIHQEFEMRPLWGASKAAPAGTAGTALHRASRALRQSLQPQSSIYPFGRISSWNGG